jgi:hypothetical protein
MDALGNVQQCEVLIGYDFGDKDLCIEALHAYPRSMTYGSASALGRVRKNDSLAVLGNLVLEEHLCRRWYAGKGSKGTLAVSLSHLYPLTATK